MFQRIHEKLGTAGFVISIVALVAALGGGAYAASNGLNGKQKKEVEKIAKKYAGKPGAQGAQGSPGAKGDTGLAGASGKDGANGGNGTNGSNGVSPAGTPFTGSKTVGSTTCTEGGVEYKGATINLVCNGAKGQTGFTETLPTGKTEKGSFAFGSLTQDETKETLMPSAISFVIPLGAAPAVTYVTAAEWEGGTQPAECPGTANEPKAAAGSLCVYEYEASYKELVGPEDTTVGGTTLLFKSKPGFSNYGYGSWAVTAE